MIHCFYLLNLTKNPSIAGHLSKTDQNTPQSQPNLAASDPDFSLVESCQRLSKLTISLDDVPSKIIGNGQMLFSEIKKCLGSQCLG